VFTTPIGRFSFRKPRPTEVRTPINGLSVPNGDEPGEPPIFVVCFPNSVLGLLW